MVRGPRLGREEVVPGVDAGADHLEGDAGLGFGQSQTDAGAFRRRQRVLDEAAAAGGFQVFRAHGAEKPEIARRILSRSALMEYFHLPSLERGEVDGKFQVQIVGGLRRVAHEHRRDGADHLGVAGDGGRRSGNGARAGAEGDDLDQRIGHRPRADMDVDEPGLGVARGDIGGRDRTAVAGGDQIWRVRRIEKILRQAFEETDARRHRRLGARGRIDQDLLAAAIGGEGLDIGYRALCRGAGPFYGAGEAVEFARPGQ